MPYQVVLKKQVIKTLETVREPYYTKIKAAIYELANDPRPPGCKKLRGRAGYRIRISDYRVIYDVFDDVLTVEVIAVGHRREIYE
ncbi:type II toxin-antitoxin system RelE family toxin [Rhodoflexus caldus]|uniref:type II toxin-antitoxin system RelE family toxin n=1 Tax=Rhodoflexus caldus TaxID=2891236 RepID=UPI002029D8D5|nr:type II toxin-antitoxin system RelE/ParE family toxin [Rhodoflexus caldus]